MSVFLLAEFLQRQTLASAVGWKSMTKAPNTKKPPGWNYQECERDDEYSDYKQGQGLTCKLCLPVNPLLSILRKKIPKWSNFLIVQIKRSIFNNNNVAGQDGGVSKHGLISSHNHIKIATKLQTKDHSELSEVKLNGNPTTIELKKPHQSRLVRDTDRQDPHHMR